MMQRMNFTNVRFAKLIATSGPQNSMPVGTRPRERSSEMTSEKFIDVIVKRLKEYVRSSRDAVEMWAEEEGYAYYEPDAPRLWKVIESDLSLMFDRGFSVEDAYRYFVNMEDIDPRISEETALMVRQTINKKYPNV
jgi:hypothetical protein